MGFTLFKFLHILTMFIAVAGAVIPEVVLHWVAGSGDVRAIRVFASIAAHVGKLLPIFFVGGAIFGLLAAATGSLDFFQPWLIAAYVVFVGAMAYAPNVAAMRYFTDEVLPIVRRTRPGARLTIVGRDPAPVVRAMASEGVDVTGEVDDVRPYLARAAVFVAPMVSGSGIKNKVLEAMAMGRPVVATPLAIEGLPLRHGENVLVADGAAGLADAIHRLLADPGEAARIGGGGRALVERIYTWDACATRYERLYQELAQLGRRTP